MIINKFGSVNHVFSCFFQRQACASIERIDPHKIHLFTPPVRHHDGQICLSFGLSRTSYIPCSRRWKKRKGNISGQKSKRRQGVDRKSPSRTKEKKEEALAKKAAETKATETKAKEEPEAVEKKTQKEQQEQEEAEGASAGAAKAAKQEEKRVKDK